MKKKGKPISVRLDKTLEARVRQDCGRLIKLSTWIEDKVVLYYEAQDAKKDQSRGKK